MARTLQLLLLTAAAASANFAQTILSPLQEPMRISLGLSDNQMAILQGPAMGLPLALGSIPLGLWIDRRSRARLILTFSALSVFATLLTAWATRFALLFVFRCLVGLSVPAVWMAALSMVADLYPPALRGRALIVIAMGQVGAMSGAFALGGGLLAVVGQGPDGWRSTLVWLAAPLVLVTCLMLFLAEPERTEVAWKEPSTRAALGELWGFRAVLIPLLAGAVMVSIVDTAALIWAAPTLSRHFALRADQAGSLMAVAILVNGLVGPLVGGTIADLCQRTGGPHRAAWVLSGLIFSSSLAGSFGVMPNLMLASVLLVIFLTTGSAISVMIAPLLTVVIPNELRGLSMATLSTVSGPLCLGLAPVLVSLLSRLTGGPETIGEALALVCSGASLAGAVTVAWGSRHFTRATGT